MSLVVLLVHGTMATQNGNSLQVLMLQRSLFLLHSLVLASFVPTSRFLVTNGGKQSSLSIVATSIGVLKPFTTVGLKMLVPIIL
jgi:hypothetical protein